MFAADPALNLVVEPGDVIYVPAVENIRSFGAGAVNHPNLYEVPRGHPLTVLKAITLAGGATERAGLKRIQIIRNRPSGQRMTLEVNLKKVKRGESEDPVLQQDDVILVPETMF